MTYNKLVNDNVWVVASAGTGKTKSLIDRIIVLLLEGISPSQILCITFTNAAASEMQARLHEVCLKLKTATDEEIVSLLKSISYEKITDKDINICRGLYGLIISDEVKIQTIHSFCLSIIKRFPVESEILTPQILNDNFKIMALIQRAINDVIFEFKDDIVIMNAVKFLTDKVDILNIQELIANLVGYRDHILDMSFDYDGLSNKYADFFAIDSKGVLNFWEFEKFEIEKKIFEKQRVTLQNFMHLLLNGSDKDIDLANTIDDFINHSKDVIEQLLGKFLTKQGSIRKNIVSKDLIEKSLEISHLLGQISKMIEESIELKKKYISAQLGFAIVIFTQKVMFCYDRIKKELGVIEYADILFKARKILTSPDYTWIQFKINSSISHILIDEAQDTNELQWEIVKAITEDFYSGESANTDKSIFVVGDPKQSIYSFQGAKHEFFLQIKEYFKAKIINSGKIFLEKKQDKSYRASKKLLYFIDKIFLDQQMTAALTGNYNPIEHFSNRLTENAEVEIWPLEKDCVSESVEGWLLPTKVYPFKDANFFLANKIAKSIESKIRSGMFLPSQNRTAQPSDFLIIFQRRSLLVTQTIAALRKIQIPVIGLINFNLSDHIAVKDVLALIRFTLFPYDNLNLAVLLRSPFIGVSEETLFDLCLETSFENTLFNKIQRTGNFLQDSLNKWIGDALKFSPYQFLLHVIDFEGNRRHFIERLGEEVNEILDELIEIAFAFEEEEISPTLFNFLYYVEYSSEKIDNSSCDQNAVKLMTVHGAKGLQAPCVILADSNFSYIRVDNFAFSNDLMFYYPSISDAAKEILKIREADVRSRENEYHRLLYVAVTRAQDALYVAGMQKGNKENTWYKYLRSAMLNVEHSNYYDEIWSGEVEKFGFLDYVETQSKKDTVFEIPEFLTQNINLSIECIEKKFENKAVLRGEVIHKLLSEYRLSMDAIYFENYVTDSLKSLSYIFSFEETNEIVETVLHVVNENSFKFIFADNVISEVPFIMHSDTGTSREGRIDKLIVCDYYVDIIDIKTNAIPEVNSDITSQMSFYKQFIKSVYEDKTVNCYILWTSNCTLQRLTDKLL